MSGDAHVRFCERLGVGFLRATHPHYPGGVWLNGNLGWGAVFLALLTRPPDPLVVGERWRALWQARLEALEPPVATWLAHARRDAYWRHGSVAEDYGAIACPTLVVGGFRDGYTSAVGRLLGGLTVPRRGILGPWAHAYPHLARPRPAGFLQEVVGWWDRWLQDSGAAREAGHMPAAGYAARRGAGGGAGDPGSRPGAMPEAGDPASAAGRAFGSADPSRPSEPMLRAWLEEVGPPDARFVERPGRWVAEPSWPSSSIRPEAWHLGAAPPDVGTLTLAPGAPGALVLAGGEAVGLAAGVWCPYGFDGELPGDQREDDAGSLCFDSAPLAERRELLGTPELRIVVAVDRPGGLLCARLCAVAPDGASTRLAYGLLSLARRDGFDRTAPVVPGERYAVHLALTDLGVSIPAGWRLRLALSTGYWPMVWPAADAVQLTVFAGPGSALALPVRPPRPEDAGLGDPGPPEGAPAAAVAVLRPAHRQTTVERDQATGAVTVVHVKDRGRLRFPDHGLVVDAQGGERLSLRHDDPLSARAETSWTVLHERGSWRVRTESRMTLGADREAFHFGASVIAYEGEQEVFRRVWDRRIPRDGV
jgi:predicted acyl esterase